MHLKSLLLTISFSLSIFPCSALALPSSPLVRRGGETVSIEWDQDASHRGTFHCFTTGTIMSASIMTNDLRLRAVCGYSESYNATSFSYEPLANGTYPHQYVKDSLNRGKGWPPDEDVLWYDTQLQGKTHASYSECRWAIEKIGLRGCPLDGRYSQGGWFQFEDDGSTYGIDPTHESYNHDGGVDSDECQ